MNDAGGQLPDGVREGEILARKYRVGATLGIGAMGIVVAARHLLLGETVALKFLLGERSQQHEAVARFVQEARSAKRIQSEHVVRVYDVERLESGVPYMVMEYLRGSDLAARLRKGGPLRVLDAVDYVLEACEAIAEAHSLGIVHRDLKPANLFLLERPDAPPSIKVLDFGISKSTAGITPETQDAEATVPSAGATQARAMLGSPFYMSPEQMKSSGEVDGRTDIWALGVTLFELVTGAPPYTGSNLVQLYTKMTASCDGAWRDVLVGFPSGLDSILEKCLHRDREERYPGVADLARALAPFGSTRSSASLLRIVCTASSNRTAQRVDEASAIGAVTMRPPLATPGEPVSRPSADDRSRTRMRRRVFGSAGTGLVAAALIALGLLTHKPSAAVREVALPVALLPMVAIAKAVPVVPSRSDVEPPASSSANVLPPSPARSEKPAALRSPKGAAAIGLPAPRPKPSYEQFAPSAVPTLPLPMPVPNSRFDEQKVSEMLGSRY